MAPSEPDLLDGLPGEELIRQGIADARRGIESVPALLVATGAPRLAGSLGELGVAETLVRPELRLYRLLQHDHGPEAYAQYNALLRRLTSFCRALEMRRRARSPAREP